MVRSMSAQPPSRVLAPAPATDRGTRAGGPGGRNRSVVSPLERARAFVARHLWSREPLEPAPLGWLRAVVQLAIVIGPAEGCNLRDLTDQLAAGVDPSGAAS